MDTNKKIEMFRKAMEEDLQTRISFMSNKLEELRQEEISNAEKEAQAKSGAVIEIGMRKIDKGCTDRINSLERKCRAELALKREEIISDVFDRAKEKLIAFTKTDEYIKFIEKCLAEIKACFNGGDFTVYLKDNDISKNIIEKNNIKTLIDKNIEIGGIIAKSEQSNFVADNTLDSKLEQQKDWFFSNCDMSIE